MADLEQKQRFLKALAVYLVRDQAKHSIGLQLGREDSLVWRDVRSNTPLFGYPTEAEAETVLSSFLNIPMSAATQPPTKVHTSRKKRDLSRD